LFEVFWDYVAVLDLPFVQTLVAPIYLRIDGVEEWRRWGGGRLVYWAYGFSGEVLWLWLLCGVGLRKRKGERGLGVIYVG
jgi:hypothetical protein